MGWALSLTQPWATLVAIGAKRIETRSWQTSFRGPIAIHAAKRFPADCQELCGDDPFYPALEAAGYYRYFKNAGGYGDRGPWSSILPTGVILATAQLVGCFPITRSTAYELPTGERIKLTEPELSFGDYTPGRFGWLFADVAQLSDPISVRGSHRLWKW